jgi:phosphatidylethanolamine-binding protein (PEBP) family uncharacterized protein
MVFQLVHRIRMLSFIKILALATLSFSAVAASKPDLKVSDGLPKLTVSFADTETWNGKRWLKAQQCMRNGGVSPIRSPALNVSGAPAGTSKLVIFINNPRAFDNHGLFSYAAKFEDGSYTVPAISSGAKDKLPKGVALFQDGSSWGAAFNAACPSSGSWKYTLTVYALD